MADNFNDELTPEEEAKLVELSEASVPPPAASAGEDADAGTQPDAQPSGEPAPAAEPVATDANADADADALQNFEAFAAKHKDRSAEELLKLAFQKEQARKTARFDAKQARDVVSSLRDDLQQRAAARAQKQEQDKAKFNETLANDPDAALAMAFDRQQTRDREEAEAVEWSGYVTAQTQICEQAIPRFREVAPEMMQFGVDRLGYEPSQVQAAHDSRDMIALYMASRFDKLVQAGVVNFDGSLANGVAPQLATPAAATPAATRQAPRTLSAASGGAGGGSRSLKDQANDLLAMSDADFDKAVEQGAFDATLRNLSGGRQ